MSEMQDTVQLSYTIHKYSSYSGSYAPQNIMQSDPTDQLSRWFTDSSTSPQFVVLKLEAPSIVESITFGKYIKAHVSDMKKFQVFGGTDDENFTELLTAGLKNDNTTETFRLRYKTREGLYLPITYLKIVPLQSWGPAYNYTIWYVELQGINDEEVMRSAMETINLRKEEEAVRILLKHLRRRRYKDAFEALSRETGVRLEGNLQSRLWTALVENADYDLAEKILEEAVTDGEFDWYLSWQPYTAHWQLLSACSARVEEILNSHQPEKNDRSDRSERPDRSSRQAQATATDDLTDCTDDGSVPLSGPWPPSPPQQPGPRGGHQLVVHTNTGNLYLYGGWSGTEDLDDLWCYDVTKEQWTLLCEHSALCGGPTPRSCHKMVLDPHRNILYTLGRYLDNAQRLPENMKSELYAFDITSGAWSCACADTAARGGPRLVFDHQMCLDHHQRVIYVFGGRVLPSNTDEAATPQYSGLYAYYIQTDTWQLLLGESGATDGLQPRVGHSMLFHPRDRKLYMFLGQRNKEQLLDLWWYDVSSGSHGALSPPAAAPAAPAAAGFTQRATLDPDTDHLHVLSGMSKEKDKGVYNSLWVVSLRSGAWSCVYRTDTVRPRQPRPRFAHQLVYDHVRKIHYLFGGNPGVSWCGRLRLDDLWALRVRRPPVSHVVRPLTARLREMRYRHLTREDPLRALRYLRKDIYEATDHSDPEQVSHFHSLAGVLFSGAPPPPGRPPLRPSLQLCLSRRRAAATPQRGGCTLAAVLGSDDIPAEQSAPPEDIPSPTPDTWDVADDCDQLETNAQYWDEREARIRLYDVICKHFRPSVTHPQVDIDDLVKL